ncbi:MAG: mechanosensitive ion channel family protein [Treponema sp.]|jgi:small-conductance mechanosensitive channel|nr:mechanosensitive ion channel family protein [Treponema sp.]
MKRLLAVIFLLLPLTFLTAQETPENETDDVQRAPEVVQNAPEDDQSAPETETADAVTSASELWVEPQPLEEAEGKLSFLQRLGIALGIVAGQALLIWLIWFLFKRLEIKLESTGKEKIKPIFINKFKLLTEKQIIKVIKVILRIVKYLITVIQLFLTIPIIFSFFQATKDIASTIFGYILNPLKDVGASAVGYIPNLFKIVIFVLITHYILKGLKFLSKQIENGKLKINGFYEDWAKPTYKILQVLLWAFTLAIIYPYLPGSDSRAFQGVSVFIGIIFSIGSTSAIGNLVAGFVITYMRPFKIGDRVQIKEITGFVVEKNLMVVRLKTHKNEYVTFPNLIILSSNIINYNTSCDENEEGLIIFAEVTFNYSTPWQKVHDILINAALATKYVQQRPKPFVLQTKLDDFYACYQINCYTKEIDKVPQIYTMLYENIQIGFKEAGLDMTSMHYQAISQNKG